MNPILKYISIVLVTAIVVGGGTYFGVNGKATTDKNSLNTQISSLQGQVTTLTNQVASLSTTTTPATTTPTTTAPTTTASNVQTYTNTTYTYSVQYPKSWYIDTTDANTAFQATKNPAKSGGSVVWSNHTFPDASVKQSNLEHVYLETLQKTSTTQSLNAFLLANGISVSGSTSFTTSSGLVGEKWISTISDTNGAQKYNNYVFQNGQTVYILSVTDINSTASAAVIADQNATVDAMALSFAITS